MRIVITRKTLIGMIFIGLTLLGYVSYKQLSVELVPNAESPYLVIQINSSLPVDAGYMEKQGVIPLEGAVGGLEGIDELTSTSSQQRGVIYVSYRPNVDLKIAELKLQERINEIVSSLPEEFRITVTKVDIQALSSQVMALEVRGTGGANRVRQLTDEKIINRIENIDGIAAVDVYGGQEKTIEVTLNNAACEAYGITPYQVRNAISSSALDRTFVGTAFRGDQRYFVHLLAEYNDIREIENLVVREKGPVLLRDIATVYFGVKEETSYSRVNGLEAVTMNLIADSQVNLIDLSHSVQKVVKTLNEELGPLGIEIVIQENMAETMEKNLSQIINLALLGGLLAIFILWIFLKNLRLVLSIALAIPISVYTAFNFFYATGITINSLTLVGMALAIGMLLDNSVVVLENIYRNASLGKKPAEAVMQGTREVWRSIVAATLTTVTVFLPFLFSDNFLVKVLGSNVGISIISTLLVSLLVALLLIPMLTHWILSGRSSRRPVIFEHISIHNRLIQSYILILKASIRKPAATIVGALVLFFVSIFLAMAVSTNTLQEAETRELRLSVTLPEGTTLEATDQVIRTMEKRLMDIEEREDLTTETQEAEATIRITLVKDYEKVKGRSLADIKADIMNRVRDIQQADVEFQQFSANSGFSGRGGGGGMGAPAGGGFEKFLGIGVQQEKVVIKGQNFELMRSVAEDLQNYLEDFSTVQSASVSAQSNRPEVHMAFNTREMGERNVSMNAITSELSSFPTEFTAGVKFKKGVDEYDILLKYDTVKEKNYRTMEDLRTMQVPASDGSTHELLDLADVFFAYGQGSINRVNQQKQIEVTYRFDNETNNSKTLLAAARTEVDDLVGSLKIPSGIAIEVVHEENQFKDFYFLIAAAFILIYMILASVFESFITPVVLMFSIPLAGIGAFLALIFTKNSLINANTLTGFIILLGIVVNNGIILIDYTNILRKRGFRSSRALITAGLARIRPILITAATTIVAMMPLAMGKSEYVSLIGAPFAITVIGGLSLSTLLTLVFIATFYSGIENALDWIKSRHWSIQLIMYLLITGLGALIFITGESFIWQLIEFLLVVIGVPAATWFILTSLRKASVQVIPETQPILIRIQNLVKIYDRDNRFIREWKSGLAIRQRKGLKKEYTKLKELDLMLWQIPLLGFLIYFVYFFLNAEFWRFLLSIGVFFTLIAVYKPLGIFLKRQKTNIRGRFSSRVSKLISGVILWGFPVVNLIILHTHWKNLALEILIGVGWYLALVIYATSNRLTREKININRITGKFGRLRRGWYRLVLSIPVIGKKKKSFKALAGVSLEIGNGMFGLLGPNGAGKTTLMRIICGILDQSYGKIWISGVDTQEKREELQGLIGYLPQEFGMYENMTAGEFLNYQGMLKGLNNHHVRSERVDYVLGAVHMLDHKNQKINSFSGGMKQRIGIAQILLHLPRILVVDEPTAGLDPRERIRFRNLLVELSRDRVVIFSTHIIEDISSSCNKVAVLDRGALKYLGTPVEMAHTAEGNVWQIEVDAGEFDQLSKQYKIVHHMREGSKIRVRLLADQPPKPDAIPVQPLLEDAYLWMLKKKV
ncbi:MAG: efflux RND transporter permease subunit [Bacteroidales bacterium]|nr:efflux RND transporter permease subunit [Bacteroidales bacterium]